MKAKGFVIIGVVTLFAAALTISCSGDNVAEQIESNEQASNTVSVKELTERLKVYNANILTRGEGSGDIGTPQTLINKRMGVVMADVKGAIRGGMRAGVKGAIVGAAIYSTAADYGNFSSIKV